MKILSILKLDTPLVLMSSKISIDVYTLSGLNKVYDVDLDTSIIDLIKMIVNTHPAFANPQQCDHSTVDWLGTRLMSKGKTLEHFQTLEIYPEFQVKSTCPHKLNIIVKGGLLSKVTGHFRDRADSQDAYSATGESSDPSSPISIRPYAGRVFSPVTATARSFPGASSSSFLENQINRIDQRSKSDQIKQVSESLSELSTYIKTVPSSHEEKLDRILALLTSIDQKLGRLETSF